MAVLEHAYTHFSVTVHAFACELLSPPGENLKWVRLSDLEEYPMGGIDRRIARKLDDGRFRVGAQRDGGSSRLPGAACASRGSSPLFRLCRAIFLCPHRFAIRRMRIRALPIGLGQTISQTYIVALMTDLLELRGEERVLEVGTGSGYQAAVLSQLCAAVYTVELDPQLAKRARGLSGWIWGIEILHFRVGDGTQGWKEAAPFDGILVTAFASQVPAPLLEQLREGSRLVMPVGTSLGPDPEMLDSNGDRLRERMLLPR